MCRKGTSRIEFNYRFFSIGLCHNDLAAYFNLNFSLMQYHGYSLEEVENLIPWEREIYISLLIKYLNDEKAKEQSRNQQWQRKR